MAYTRTVFTGLHLLFFFDSKDSALTALDDLKLFLLEEYAIKDFELDQLENDLHSDVCYEGNVGFANFSPLAPRPVNNGAVRIHAHFGNVFISAISLEKFLNASYKGQYIVNLTLPNFVWNKTDTTITDFWARISDLYLLLDTNLLLAGDSGRSTLADAVDPSFPFRIDEFLWDFSIFGPDKIVYTKELANYPTLYSRELSDGSVLLAPNFEMQGMVEEDYVSICDLAGLRCPWRY